MSKQDTNQRIDALEAQVIRLTEQVHELQQAQAARAARRAERDYGPKSERKMDNMSALRILVGRWSGMSVREIADTHGFSRGQVYSLKGGYTMKSAHKTAEAIRARRATRLAEYRGHDYGEA